MAGLRDHLPSIQINVVAIYPNALPQNITPSSNPGALSTNDTMLPLGRVECTILCAGNILVSKMGTNK